MFEGFLVFFFPHAQKLVRFLLATQNDGPFPEWIFLTNTFIFRLNCLSDSSRWVGFDETLHLERPKPQVQQELVEREEIVGIFCFAFSPCFLPTIPPVVKWKTLVFWLYQPQRSGDWRDPEALLPQWMARQELFVLECKQLAAWQTHSIGSQRLIKP